MKLLRFFLNHNIISFQKAIEYYPVFRLLGIKIKISDNYKNVKIKIPARWYSKNNNNTIFGGLLLLASDPFPALLFEKHFDNVKAWTITHSIEYLRPMFDEVYTEININKNDLIDFEKQLQNSRTAKKEFTYFFYDKKNHKVAKITTTSLVRKTIKNKTIRK